MQSSSRTLPANDSRLRDRREYASNAWTRHRPFICLLALASILRVVLVVQGGQLYWPDERLYTQVLDLLDLNRHSWFAMIKALLATRNHLGFALVSAVPAGLQLAAGHALSRADNGLMMLPGLALSQISVASIALVYAIARRAGRDRVEALVAAGLMASATTMFYYARHLLPYDSAMALGLLALWCGLGGRLRDSFLCGVFASAAFITYNGYWLLAAIVVVAHLFREGRTSIAGAVRPALYAAAGGLIVPLVIMGAELATGAPLLIGGMRRLAGTVTDGYAPEGFSVPWAYLWHAEHAVLLLWLVAALFVVFDPGSWNSSRRRVATVWIGCALTIYLGLAFSSSLLHAFVVMGRQSRQMVPFLCLAAAAALAELFERRQWRPWVAATCVAVLALQVGWNFRQPLQQRFPRDVIAEITAKYGPIDFESSIEGPPAANAHVESRWVLLNAQHLYHPRAPRPPLPPGITEVMRFPHPLQFLPYQYEGFEPMERQLLRTNDIAMRLIDIGTPVDPLP